MGSPWVALTSYRISKVYWIGCHLQCSGLCVIDHCCLVVRCQSFFVLVLFWTLPSCRVGGWVNDAFWHSIPFSHRISWGFYSSCVSIVHELAGDYWVDDETFKIFLTDFIDLLKRDLSFFKILFLIIFILWWLYPVLGQGYRSLILFDINCMLAQDQLTSDRRFCSSSVSVICELAWNQSWWWNTYNLQQRNKLLYSKWTE